MAKEAHRQRARTSLLDRTQDMLHRYHLHARKNLGQHFLINEDTLQAIITAAELNPEDIVVEVGPGLGILTAELASRVGKLFAIELDDQLSQILKQTLANNTNVTIINQDILEVEPAELLGSSGIPGAPYKVVANLPYYITAITLRRFLEASVKPTRLVVMIQKEVAQAITAKPGDMSLLAISVQFYGKPTIVAKVPADSFYPVPEVDSAILRIDVYPEPAVKVSDIEGFFDLVRAGFSSPRKQLHNALSRRLNLSQEEVNSLLEKVGIQPQRRAQTLSLEEWADLWQLYEKSRSVV